LATSASISRLASRFRKSATRRAGGAIAWTKNGALPSSRVMVTVPRARLVDDQVRHAAQRHLDARPHLWPVRGLRQPLLQPALMAVQETVDLARAMPGGTVTRRPRPPASMRRVRRRARSFSTMRSGRVRPATSCSRSTVRADGGAARSGFSETEGHGAERIGDSKILARVVFWRRKRRRSDQNVKRRRQLATPSVSKIA
jgi:hypothetical protein